MVKYNSSGSIITSGGLVGNPLGENWASVRILRLTEDNNLAIVAHDSIAKLLYVWLIDQDLNILQGRTNFDSYITSPYQGYQNMGSFNNNDNTIYSYAETASPRRGRLAFFERI